MTDRGQRRELKPVPGIVFGLAGALATASIAALAVFFAAPRPADALPAYAQQTGLACGRCHVNPAGGGARTPFGNAFAANGHKVPSKGAKPGKTSANEGAPAAAPTASTTSAARPIDLYYAQAQSLSFRRPYYSHFLYSPNDYRD